MQKIKIGTSDNKIWNQAQVYSDITQAMIEGFPFVLDLLSEGPDLSTLGLYDFLTVKSTQLGFDLDKITVITANALEKHSQIKILYRPPVHLLDYAKDYIIDIVKKSNLKHFGMFIGRGTAQRLHLAAYLDQHCSDQLIMSYHFNFADDFHANNIGLDDLIKYYGIHDVRGECNFLYKCPVRLRNGNTVVIDKTLPLNPSQQFFKNDQDYFAQTYQDFFVEIVCESYCTGQTFFPTEKIFRPMLLKTPFIVQGPRYFLHNLKTLGFRTFSDWWDEGYSEDPDGQQTTEIKRVIDVLACKTPQELSVIYKEMESVLDHNYHTAMSMTQDDFKQAFNWI